MANFAPRLFRRLPLLQQMIPFLPLPHGRVYVFFHSLASSTSLPLIESDYPNNNPEIFQGLHAGAYHSLEEIHSSALARRPASVHWQRRACPAPALHGLARGALRRAHVHIRRLQEPSGQTHDRVQLRPCTSTRKRACGMVGTGVSAYPCLQLGEGFVDLLMQMPRSISRALTGAQLVGEPWCGSTTSKTRFHPENPSPPHT
ncbi:hypothetical protein FA95DRAFT_1198788 [Auriscalpium vulgare]|uniref:Uncharacterized protein n=1 Tax=Auriscalpium vulgare TaxID=40419 RepID=A0ACB8RW11_9AGAM|nr:hypothetical protein FA95DRAFT_1198788 [Auriscalpium vulgare]